MSKILFSAIGATDPMSNFCDGSMLHICRQYKPDIVYLYLSEEMKTYHEKDNRYVGCINSLSEKINHKFDVRIISGHDLDEVHIFDKFIGEYKEELIQIHDQYPDSEILLNVSSGTPAMKNALQNLSAFLSFKTIPIQTSTPVKKCNERPYSLCEYNYKEHWAVNEDNEPDSKNRCKVSSTISFYSEIQMDIIRKFIDEYDYFAAFAIAKNIENFISSDFIELLDGACKRIHLDFDGAKKVFNKYGKKVIPFEQPDKAKIFEYLLWLQIKVKKQEYLDFIRGITPLIMYLFKEAFEKVASIKLADLTEENRCIWSRQKLADKERQLEILNKRFNKFKYGNVYSSHLAELICENNNPNFPKIADDTKKIRKIEENCRNVAAHQIVSVTEEWVKKNCGYTPDEILARLKKYCKYTSLIFSGKDCKSYDDMNKILKEML